MEGETEPLKDMFIDGIVGSNVTSPYGDGKIYLAPFNSGPMGLVYNKTLFEEKGWEIPTTGKNSWHWERLPKTIPIW